MNEKIKETAWEHGLSMFSLIAYVVAVVAGVIMFAALFFGYEVVAAYGIAIMTISGFAGTIKEMF